MGFMGIIWVIVLVLIIWWAWSYFKRNRDAEHSKTAALDILKERYAKGEIGKAEFEEKKKDLT